MSRRMSLIHADTAFIRNISTNILSASKTHVAYASAQVVTDTARMKYEVAISHNAEA